LVWFLLLHRFAHDWIGSDRIGFGSAWLHMRATTAETMEERSWPARRIYYILCVTQRGRESNQLASGGCVHARSMVCAWWPVQLYVCTYIPYLEQLADIAGAEDLVHAGELVRLPGREVGREDAAGRAPAPQQLARRARRRPGCPRLRSSSSCRGPGPGHRHDHRGVPHRSANGSGELEASRDPTGGVGVYGCCQTGLLRANWLVARHLLLLLPGGGWLAECRSLRVLELGSSF
jgi:hypothetical protein